MNLKARYAETEKKLRSENVKLADDHRRATEAFKDLQIKCRHFEQTDTRKHREVWEMNRELVAEKVRGSSTPIGCCTSNSSAYRRARPPTTSSCPGSARARSRAKETRRRRGGRRRRSGRRRRGE